MIVGLARFNVSNINDMALAMTIFDEAMELLGSIKERTPPEAADERRAFDNKLADDEIELYNKAADLFEGLTGVRIANAPARLECHLGHDPFPDQCCCICSHRYEDRHHPDTDGGHVTDRRGWVCVADDVCFSGWPEHSIGCEMFERRKDT